MARHILASNGDMDMLLFGPPDFYDFGKVRWEEDSPPFLTTIRERAASYDELLYVLCEALHGRDEEIATAAKKDITDVIKAGWEVHPAIVTAIRSCNAPTFGQGFDAGVALAMARYLRDYSLEYTNSAGDEHSDLYCFKEKQGPSTFSVHLGKDSWLTHEMKLSIPTVPRSLEVKLIGMPMSEVIDHPSLSPDDIVASFSHGNGFIDISGLKPRPLKDYDFAPMKTK